MPTAAEPLQNPAAAPKHPLWVRSMLCVWIVLFGALSCAQAAHIHGWGSASGQGKAQVSQAVDATQTPGGEENCPLCTAMHIAVHTPSFPVVVVSFAESFAPVSATQLTAPKSLWHYDLFGRPPPALLNS